MKYLKSYNESVQSYDWELESDNERLVKYTFEDSESNRYLVEFKNIRNGKYLGTEYELVYFVYDESVSNYNVSKIVNVNPFKISQTVFGDILNDFLKRKSWAKVIRIEGLSKNVEKQYVSQRTKMYMRFLERNPIDGYRLENYGNRINLIKI